MTDVLIHGGGFAGVGSAEGAARPPRSVGDYDLHVRFTSNPNDMGFAGTLMTLNGTASSRRTASPRGEIEHVINTQWINGPATVAEALPAIAGQFSNET